VHHSPLQLRRSDFNVSRFFGTISSGYYEDFLVGALPRNMHQGLPGFRGVEVPGICARRRSRRRPNKRPNSARTVSHVLRRKMVALDPLELRDDEIRHPGPWPPIVVDPSRIFNIISRTKCDIKIVRYFWGMVSSYETFAHAN